MLIHLQNGQVTIVFNTLEASLGHAYFMSVSVFHRFVIFLYSFFYPPDKLMCHRLICYKNIMLDDGPSSRPHLP